MDTLLVLEIYPVSVDENQYQAELKKNGTLLQNHPNPFSQSTVINYQLLVPSNVILKVYDVFGNEVRTLVDEYQAAGSHSAVFRSENLPPGMYYYTLKISGSLQSGKMVKVD